MIPHITILGIRIDQASKQDALKIAEHFLYSNSQHTIFTPNPEFLVKAYHDNYFGEILNKSDLNLCDGKGIQLVSTWFPPSPPNPLSDRGGVERIPGVDFMMELCSLAERLGRSIYLLGSGSDEVVKKTVEALQSKFPRLNIAGYDKGSTVKEISNVKLPLSGLEVDEKNELIIKKIQKVKPDILFVAFGMGKQEKWIYENLNNMPSVKIAMGVGGAFDFISGVIARAPVWMRRIGLEWLYRLIKEPRRIKRILNATIVFTYLIFKNSIKK